MGVLRVVEPWLPDFCRRSRVLAMLGMAELVVVVAALWPTSKYELTLVQFLSVSAFSMWLSIAVAILLCAVRRPLSRFPPVLGVAAILGLAGLMAVFAAGVVFGLYAAVGQPPEDVGFLRFIMGCAVIAVMITALALRYFYVSDRWVTQLNAHASARADALQARIRPHFLFNSMNLIASLIRSDTVVAERAVLDLSDLFRAALDVGEGDSTLSQEVELARRYLSIESLRLGHRLQVEWRLQEPLPWTLQLPHLVLQPLVENAVLHGVSRMPQGGLVEIEMRVEAGLLHIRIRNPAPTPDAGLRYLEPGAGHAQRNIAYRLEHKFNHRARLGGGWKEGFYSCEVMVPLR